MHNATIIALNLVRHSIYLDKAAQPLNHGDDVEAASANGEPVFKLAQAIHFRVNA
jgi:hypothetical protein